MMGWAANLGSLRPNPLKDYAPLHNRAVDPRDRQAPAAAPAQPDVFFHARRTGATTPRRLDPMHAPHPPFATTRSVRDVPSSAAHGGYLKKRGDVTVWRSGRPAEQNYARKHISMGGGTAFAESARRAPFPYTRPEASALEGFPGLVNNSYMR